MNARARPQWEGALAPYAATESRSLGRRVTEPAPQYRGEYQRDRDRIIHSAAFRRLEYKTQVFVNHEGDLYRTRLTHSLEVAQIGRTVARALGLNEDLTEAVALAHDLGHTPFGHAGQDALNDCLRPWGGFEHNWQSLRVVDELESHYPGFDGLNLLFETREGILKHCTRERAAELGDVARRFIDGGQPVLEAQVVNLADEIAYNSHDIDDGLRAGLITLDGLCEVPLCAEEIEGVRRAFPGIDERLVVHEFVRRLIGRQVADLIGTTRALLQTAGVESVDGVRAHPEPLAGFSPEMRERNLILKRYLREHMYRHWRVHTMSVKAARMLCELFNAFMADERLLPEEQRAASRRLRESAGEAGVARAVADYLAGMTDRYAFAEHQRVVQPDRMS